VGWCKIINQRKMDWRAKYSCTCPEASTFWFQLHNSRIRSQCLHHLSHQTDLFDLKKPWP